MLNAHQREVHEGKLVPSKEKLPCKICGVRMQSWKMKKHMEIIHEGQSSHHCLILSQKVFVPIIVLATYKEIITNWSKS